MFKHPEQIELEYNDFMKLKLKNLKVLKKTLAEYESENIHIHNGLSEVVFAMKTNSLEINQKRIIKLIEKTLVEFENTFNIPIEINIRSSDETVSGNEEVYFELPFEHIYQMTNESEQLNKHINQ